MIVTSDRLKVLVVDDSAIVRQVIKDFLSEDPEIGMVETASDANVALSKVIKIDPDVVTLDVEMPEMDGLEILERIMRDTPRPVIMLSAYTSKGAVKTLRALELGAVDFIQKPIGRLSKDVIEVKDELLRKIKAVAAKKRKHQNKLQREFPGADHAKFAEIRKFAKTAFACPAGTILAMGASTGGTEVIREILRNLASDFPMGVVIVQHMPEGFTRMYAERLNELCTIKVKEAEHKDMIVPGRALIAPGDHHMTVKSTDLGAYVELSRGPIVNGHRPSVDMLFCSVAEQFKKRSIGVILTGMGKDGASGMKKMFDKGALTVAQDEDSSVVFGMPKAAIEEKGVGIVANVSGIIEVLHRESKGVR